MPLGSWRTAGGSGGGGGGSSGSAKDCAFAVMCCGRFGFGLCCTAGLPLLTDESPSTVEDFARLASDLFLLPGADGEPPELVVVIAEPCDWSVSSKSVSTESGGPAPVPPGPSGGLPPGGGGGSVKSIDDAGDSRPLTARLPRLREGVGGLPSLPPGGGGGVGGRNSNPPVASSSAPSVSATASAAAAPASVSESKSDHAPPKAAAECSRVFLFGGGPSKPPGGGGGSDDGAALGAEEGES